MTMPFRMAKWSLMRKYTGRYYSPHVSLDVSRCSFHIFRAFALTDILPTIWYVKRHCSPCASIDISLFSFVL